VTATSAMWVSVVRKVYFASPTGSGLSRRSAQGAGNVITAQSQRSLMVWLPGQSDVRIEGRDVQLFDSTYGLNVGNVTAIYAQGKQVWVGGELGFARLRRHGASSPYSAHPAKPFTGVSGIVGHEQRRSVA